MNKLSDIRYLSVFTLLLLAGAVLASVLVLLVDPYGLYGVVNRENFNALKLRPGQLQIEIKGELARRSQAQFIILGNSRAELGFDPRSTAFGAMAGKGYNLAVPGSSLLNSAHQFSQLAQSGVRPDMVIVGVDFIEFLKPVIFPALPDRSAQFWQFDALFSLTSLKDALATVRAQRAGKASGLSAEGFSHGYEYVRAARRDGDYKVFERRARKSAANFWESSKTQLRDGHFDVLHAFLLDMAAAQADVRLVIYPYHAQMLTLIEGGGVWPLFEAWKQQLVEQVEAVKKRYPSARITVTDFSGFGPYQCSALPKKGEGAVGNPWYWEAGHFKHELGEVVLQRLMAPQASGDSFGMQLTRAGLAGNSDRIAAERRACMAAQPELFLSSRKMFEQPLEMSRRPR